MFCNVREDNKLHKLSTMKAEELREKFLDFFKGKGHKAVESDSLVPKEDPTVLFTPAGMNQFKKEFMGFDSGFRRAATCQRCLRTDDLEKVGKTSSHLTFFEMLGNFSFGDYFKQEAIAWAWEFLTKELKISPDRLWVSVYKNDDEAYSIWKNEVGIPEGRIVRLGDKDNFWPAEAKEKGPNGPCGPCSEIFYDFGPGTGCLKSTCDPSCSCGRFVEIWNLVFTQFNRKDGGALEPLPNKNIDTGMGLERLTAVMQGRRNNFETELFQPVIDEIRRHMTCEPEEAQRLLYALADHIRAVVFSIYDGITPSNEGRGYIVRKIIRKSVMHLRSLGIEKPFLNRLVGELAQIMHSAYPDLKDRQEDIAQVILNEETNFINTLKLSGALIDSEIEKIKEDLNKDPRVDGFIIASDGTGAALGNICFKLYDTNGIPPEITRNELKSRLISVGKSFEETFQDRLNEQKVLSKSSSKMKGDVFSVPKHAVEGLKKTQFLGYDQSAVKSKIVRTIEDDDHPDRVGIILDKTVFYAESGGQVSDTGILASGSNIFPVVDVQKIDDVFIHWINKAQDFPKTEDTVEARIDSSYRMNVARNHTATHILQAALRQVLGGHVQQQGSLVNAEKLRFDFTHFKGLSKEELAGVEEAANGYISGKQAVRCDQMSLKDAKKTGALAFFEEKYGETVRVVSIDGVSKEFCGGTHLGSIDEIGLIKITGESSVASGIRRIEAVTGEAAKKFVEEQKKKAAEESRKKDRLKVLKEEDKKKSAEMNRRLLDLAPALAGKALEAGGINFVSAFEVGMDMRDLRSLADKVREGLKHGVVVLGSGEQGKAHLVVALTPDLLERGLDASVLIRQAASEIGGSGGGRPDFAQAGGTKPENFALAFEKLRDIIKGLPAEGR